jgi:pilus assembly protein CpaB
MKLFRNKFIIGILCILVALALGFVALPALQRTGGQIITVTAVRLKEPVSAGTRITADMLESVKTPQNLVLNGISDVSQAVGRYAKTDLYAGDYLTSAKTTTTQAGLTPFSAGVSKGKLVVSVALPSLASGVSGRLQPGDVVTVMSVPKGTASQTLGTGPESGEDAGGDKNPGGAIDPGLKNLEICMVAASDGSDANVQTNPGKDGKNTLPATVSFYVTEAQAKKLAGLEQTGTLQLAFVARGPEASKYLPDRVLTGTEAK